MPVQSHFPPQLVPPQQAPPKRGPHLWRRREVVLLTVHEAAQLLQRLELNGALQRPQGTRVRLRPAAERVIARVQQHVPAPRDVLLQRLLRAQARRDRRPPACATAAQGVQHPVEHPTPVAGHVRGHEWQVQMPVNQQELLSAGNPRGKSLSQRRGQPGNLAHHSLHGWAGVSSMRSIASGRRKERARTAETKSDEI